MKPQGQRVAYPALNGWRGVCALLVALFHFRFVWGVEVNSRVVRMPLVHHASLFVDFFFVLSGFVIAYRYRDGLVGHTFRLRDFLALRLARLYPLHLFTLALVFALFVFFRYGADGAPRVRWSGVDASPVAFVVNLFLAQGLHVLPGPSWNHPSWSISAEFATYLAYGFLWVTLRTRTWIATTLILIVSPWILLVLNGDNINVTYDWGFVRSTLGFALGTIAFTASRHPRVQETFAQLSRRESTVIELLLLGFTYAFVTLAADSPYSLAGPFLFAGVVLAFSEARGAVTAALVSRPIQVLGRLSYSIYMLHYPLQIALMYAAVVLSASGWTFLFTVEHGPNGPQATLGRTPGVGDAATILMLVILVAASFATYRWVEQPWRVRGRRWVALRRRPTE